MSMVSRRVEASTSLAVRQGASRGSIITSSQSARGGYKASALRLPWDLPPPALVEPDTLVVKCFSM